MIRESASMLRYTYVVCFVIIEENRCNWHMKVKVTPDTLLYTNIISITFAEQSHSFSVEWQRKLHINALILCASVQELLLTLSRVWLDTVTNFPAVRLNFLPAMRMMKTRQCWKETGAPTQWLSHTASLMLSAWKCQHLQESYLILTKISYEIRFSYMLRFTLWSLGVVALCPTAR
jgi:hypothetical protein